MSKNYMIIILKPPNKQAKVIKIVKRLKDMEKLVGGVIEEKRYENVILVYNEDQKDPNLKNNILFNGLNLKGNVLIVGNYENEGDIRSLSKREVAKYMGKLRYKPKVLGNEI